ncbi:MAG: hypothetical protein WCJ29_01320 [bacterium]
MASLYHEVPSEMVGKELIPLNELLKVAPDAHAKALAKYLPIEDQNDREWLMRRHIKALGNCLWNDVLHFCPVHPFEIWEEVAHTGKPFPRDFFEIDTRHFDPKKLEIFVYSKAPNANEEEFSDDEFVPYTSGALVAYGKTLPEAARAYFRSLKVGDKFRRYHLVPHVLYRGTVNIDKAKRIQVP